MAQNRYIGVLMGSCAKKNRNKGIPGHQTKITMKKLQNDHIVWTIIINKETDNPTSYS